MLLRHTACAVADLLAGRCRKASVARWAYCLMPNHVDLILVPATADGLARAIGATHRQYTGFVNARARWTGHLSQGRFSSVAWDEEPAPNQIFSGRGAGHVHRDQRIYGGQAWMGTPSPSIASTLSRRSTLFSKDQLKAWPASP
jgi:hypothetical protein